MPDHHTTATPVTVEDIDAQGVTCTVSFAARALGLGQSSAYRLIQNGTFPCRVIHVGARYSVPTAELKRLLGLGEVQAS